MPTDLEETRAVLGELARRKGAELPPEFLVDRVLAATEGTDWPTRRAAMEALLRRFGFAERDELTIDETPGRGRIHGTYRLAGKRGGSTQRKQRAARPYTTELLALTPFRGSCDCADFLRGSLGICKHLLVVAGHVFESERRVAAARRELDEDSGRLLPILRWDPVRPFRGDGDRLRGLTLETPANPIPDGRRTTRGRAASREHAKWFDGARPLPSALADPARRRDLLRALEHDLKASRLVAESAARALVRDELELAERRLAAVKATPSLFAETRSLKRKLYPYQVEGVRRFLEARRLLLADDMGLGKTTQAIAACHALFRAGEVERGLIIVPASLKSQWLREWDVSTDIPAEILDGGPEDRRRQFRRIKRGFLVMNYEQLLRDLGEVHRFAPDMVVLDEAQRIKNWATKSSLSVKTLTPEWRLVLTGTPMENRLEELASILDWIDDVALTPKWRLVPWHTTYEGNGCRGRVGARHLDTLRVRLAPCTVRRIRKEVLAQLPPRTDTRVPVPMTEQQRAEHDELSVPIASLVRRAHQRPLKQAEFLQLMSLLATQRIISNGLAQLWFEDVYPTLSEHAPDGAALERAFAPKLGELQRLIAELAVEQGRKVVVFSQWRSMLRLAAWAVGDVLADAGLTAAFFTGAESQKVRTRNVVDFHDDPRCAVLLLTDAGGVGLNLQRAASACINLELPWNPAVLEQRIGRIYRLGQTSPIDVYNIVTDYGIEARIDGLIATKKALFSGLFDGTTDEVRFDGKAGFLADVERLVEPVAIELPVGVPESDAADDAVESDAADAADDAVESAETARVAMVRERDTTVAVARLGAAPETEAASAPVLAGEASPVETASAKETSRSPSALLGHLKLTRTDDGTVRLEAPPEAADDLIRLFEGMASLLRESRAG